MEKSASDYQKPVMGTVHRTAWISRHQLVLFFVFTFLLSWTIFVVGAKAPFDNPTASDRVVLIGAYGPALAALLLSKITSPKSADDLSIMRRGLFIPAFFIGAGIEWLDHIWWGHQVDWSLILADTILVTLAALTISWLLSSPRERDSGFTTGEISWWRRFPWLLVALGLWPFLVLASTMIASVFGLPLTADPAWPDKPLPLMISESLLWFALFGGPLNEEPGWRGFALPRLQRRFSPLIASIILGAFWGLWHLPLHLLGVYGGGAFGAVIRFMDIPRAILFTWIYNRTKGSLLIAILFHAAVNTTSLFLPRSHHVVFVLCFVAAIVVVLTDKMWRKSPSNGYA